MHEGSSKGVAVTSIIEAIRDTMGEAQFRQFTAELPPTTRALVERRILAVEWIPIADWVPITEHLFTGWCGGDEAKLMAQARQSCRRDFTTLYRFFLRVLSPSYVLQRTTRIFHTYINMGNLEIVSQRRIDGHEHVELHLENFYPCLLLAATTQAYISEVLTLAQAKDLKVGRRNVTIAGARLSCDYDVSFAS